MSRLTVVGIGADGWSGLGDAARAAIESAQVVIGSLRQLALVDHRRAEPAGQQHIQLPTPLHPGLAELLGEHSARSVVVLASGDPMFHGIGVTLARMVGPTNMTILPAASSASLACARLGWPLHDTTTVSTLNRPLEPCVAALRRTGRALILSTDGTTPTQLARVLQDAGLGTARLWILEQLGGPHERVTATTVSALVRRGPVAIDSLNIVAVESAAQMSLSLVPGLDDAAFENDGQLTKREIRAVTLSSLAPRPGQLLWDVGAGSGSVAIEWCRSDPTCRAIMFEMRDDRRLRAAENARTLGVANAEIAGSAPDGFADAPQPDAIFIGGGSTNPGLIDACVARLGSGGRLVVNAVTLQGEAMISKWAESIGGELSRIAISHVEPLGGFQTWRPQLPITQWVYRKP